MWRSSLPQESERQETQEDKKTDPDMITMRKCCKGHIEEKKELIKDLLRSEDESEHFSDLWRREKNIRLAADAHVEVLTKHLGTLGQKIITLEEELLINGKASPKVETHT